MEVAFHFMVYLALRIFFMKNAVIQWQYRERGIKITSNSVCKEVVFLHTQEVT